MEIRRVGGTGGVRSQICLFAIIDVYGVAAWKDVKELAAGETFYVCTCFHSDEELLLCSDILSTGRIL
jgi:hypothetical protein